MPNGFSKSTEPIKPEEARPIEIKVMPEQFLVKKMKRERNLKPILVVVMLIVVLGLMAGAAYLFTRSLEKKPTPTPPTNLAANLPTNVPVNVPEVNAPTNVPTNVPVNVPPAPVCGNGTCETGENSTNCPADCPPSPPTPPVVVSASDQDKDGLTDEEEKIYTTGVSNPDSDGDSYVDGLEVINLYNPIGFAPVRIVDSGLVEVYNNPTFNYSIFYPKTWISRALDETNREVLFTSATGEFVQVIVQENPEKISVLDWYLKQNPNVTAAQVGTVVTKTGLQGIRSPDGLTVYFGNGDYIFAVAYQIGNRTEVNFETTFEMMVRSFKL
jgi:hypothetical protein